MSTGLNYSLDDVAYAAREATIIIGPIRAEKEARNRRLALGRQLRWVCQDS